jgi:hypothetical protein
MKLEDILNKEWLDPKSLRKSYRNATPFPHIVMKNFIKNDVLENVANEFPDLSKLKDSITKFDNDREVKFASRGMGVLSPSALELNTYLNSDLFLEWLNELTSIEEPLISDPYLAGGGYHEIKSGGFLKVHADFNKHPTLNLDRRLNLLIYLNKNWDKNWGGRLQLFDESLGEAVQTVVPAFNTAVIFTTTSFTYHGHPDPLKCPSDRSRKSLAYYYFSTGRPKSEMIAEEHSTLFKERVGEKFSGRGVNYWKGVNIKYKIKSVILELTPPIIIKAIKSIL